MIYPILVTAALLCVWGTTAYMSVCGLAAIFGGQPAVAVALAIGLELGKLITVIHLHRAWRRLTVAARIFYTLVVTILVAVTAIDAGGYLVRSHQQDTAAVTIDRARLSGLGAEEQALRHRIAVVDGTLAQLPEGYVTRRIAERAAAGYDILQQRLAENLAAQNTLKVDLARAQTQAGPIAALAILCRADQGAALIAFVALLVSIMEPLSIGLAVAASMAWSAPPAMRMEVPVVSIENGRPLAETAKLADPDGRPRPTAEEAAHAAHPLTKELARIVARHNLSIKDLADITGRKQLETVDGWMRGNPVIPIKAMREIRRWAGSRPPVRLLKRQAGGMP